MKKLRLFHNITKKMFILHNPFTTIEIIERMVWQTNNTVLHC
jgi:hypothetical protein